MILESLIKFDFQFMLFLQHLMHFRTLGFCYCFTGLKEVRDDTLQQTPPKVLMNFKNSTRHFFLLLLLLILQSGTLNIFSCVS